MAIKWQCPKCKRIVGAYYVKTETQCALCGLNIANFQRYEPPKGNGSNGKG